MHGVPYVGPKVIHVFACRNYPTKKFVDLGWACILCFLTKLNNSNGDRCAQRWGTFSLLAWRSCQITNYVSNTFEAKGVWVVKCLVVRCFTLVGEHFIMHKFSFTKGSLFKKHDAHFSECLIFQENCPLFYCFFMMFNRYPWASRQLKINKSHLGLDTL